MKKPGRGQHQEVPGTQTFKTTGGMAAAPLMCDQLTKGLNLGNLGDWTRCP